MNYRILPNDLTPLSRQMNSYGHLDEVIAEFLSDLVADVLKDPDLSQKRLQIRARASSDLAANLSWLVLARPEAGFYM